MLTYWKITFTIALVGAAIWTVKDYVPTNLKVPFTKSMYIYKCLDIALDLLWLAFMAFLVIGMAFEVWL